MVAVITIRNEEEMRAFGEKIGGIVRPGDIVELVGDVGAGKTTLVRGIAKGMGVEEAVQSPSFTISREYDASDERLLVHYDFYRLDDPGIMADELAESVAGKEKVVVIEWADIVESVLPADRLTVLIRSNSEDARSIQMTASGPTSKRMIGGLS